MNNNKQWFEAHRAQYEAEVKAPMLALLADLEAEFGPPHRVSRPNRDIRFSADKSPYKLNMYADCERGGYVAAAGKTGKGAVGVAVDLGGRLGEESKRLEGRALPVVPLVQHRFHASASPFRCCNAPYCTAFP
jgi:hypothetical protein